MYLPKSSKLIELTFCFGLLEFLNYYALHYHWVSWPAKLIQTLDATIAAASALPDLPESNSPDVTADM